MFINTPLARRQMEDRYMGHAAILDLENMQMGYHRH